MSKKNFRDSPALAYIKPQINTQYDTQQNTHEAEEINTKSERIGYIRTQGRKGHKKPRINLAFDSDDFLEHIRTQAEQEGKSITQFVNDAVSCYIEERKNKE
jgi:hypothetical protein